MCKSPVTATKLIGEFIKPQKPHYSSSLSNYQVRGRLLSAEEIQGQYNETLNMTNRGASGNGILQRGIKKGACQE